MKIAILGTGMVGQTLAARFRSLGHDVTIGTRDVDAARARTDQTAMGTPGFGTWYADHADIALATLSDAASAAELVIHASQGASAIDALTQAGADNLAGKVVLDVSLPLDFSTGMPTLSVANTDSLGEQIQRAFPAARVVKSLNVVNAAVMADPSQLVDQPTMFLAGDDDGAKARVRGLLEQLGWEDILDLGGIASARGTEMVFPLWMNLYGVVGSPVFGLKVVR